MARLLSPELWSPSRPTLPGPRSPRPHEIKSPLGVRDLHLPRHLPFLPSEISNLKFEISDAFAFLSGLTYFAAHHLKFGMRIPSPLILTNLLKRNTSSGSRKSQFLIRPIKPRLDRPGYPRTLRRYLLQQSRKKRSPLRNIALTNPPHAISPIRSNIPANRMHA